MKSGVSVFTPVLVACFFIQIATAAEPETGSSSEQIQDAKAHITALHEALSKAQNRVS